MHATARETNVARVVNVLVAGLTLTGSPRLVLLGDTVSQVGPDPTVRLSMASMGNRHIGAAANGAGYQARRLLSADVFWPSGEDTQTPPSVYESMQCADDIRAAFALGAFPLLDYSSDPDNPTTVDGAVLRVVDGIEIRDLPTTGGLSHRQVLIPLQWTQVHAAA